jgi:hypothetical protein
VRRRVGQRGGAAARPVRTPGSLLRSGGRALLWCLVAVLLRGVSDVFATREPERVIPVARTAGQTWPDDQARALAVDFARAYLTTPRREPDRYARAVLRFVSPELGDAIVPQLPRRGRDEAVQDAMVAHAGRVDASHALVTVAAATVWRGGAATRFLTVPVARDARGGLAVYDLPSFASPPARAHAKAPAREPLSAEDSAQVEGVRGRFFRAYLAGRADDLEYRLAAQARVGALAQPSQLVGLDSLSEDGRQGARERRVLVTLRARCADGRGVPARLPGAAGARGPLVRGGSQHDAGGLTGCEG